MATCPTSGCTEVNPPGARYCGECGAPLAVRPAALPPEDPRRHVEIEVAPDLAAVSDVGCNPHHLRNEDFVGVNRDVLAAGAVQVLIVADGVSLSQSAEAASRVAVEAAGLELVSASRQLAIGPEVMQEAILDAHAQICRLPFDRSLPIDGPGSTIVAALVAQGRAFIGWSGDSRAYWIGPGRALQLTRDHSFAVQEIEAGRLTPDQAMKDPNAHAILQCLGMANLQVMPEPSVITHMLPPEGGRLLLCSDGLWNYLSGPDQLLSLLDAAGPGASALDQARHLVGFARQAGGADNITAAVLIVPPSER